MSSGRGESLAQRVAETNARRLGTPLAATSDPVPAIKHCWYAGPHGRQASLLLEWRKVENGYDGRIAVAVPDPAGWGLVEMWVDSALLEPA
jgi:hypothetical protein